MWLCLLLLFFLHCVVDQQWVQSSQYGCHNCRKISVENVVCLFSCFACLVFAHVALFSVLCGCSVVGSKFTIWLSKLPRDWCRKCYLFVFVLCLFAFCSCCSFFCTLRLASGGFKGISCSGAKEGRCELQADAKKHWTIFKPLKSILENIGSESFLGNCRKE